MSINIFKLDKKDQVEHPLLVLNEYLTEKTLKTRNKENKGAVLPRLSALSAVYKECSTIVLHYF